MSEKIADELHNLGQELGALVNEITQLKEKGSDNQGIDNVYNHALQIKDKYNSLVSDLVEFSRNRR